jgi:ribulose-phosphate 3-epimerase
MPVVAPSILVQSEEDFRERISQAELRNLAPIWHIDVLDGTMFNNSSWADFSAMKDIPDLPPIELHCMVQNPLPVIEQAHQMIPTVRRAIVHAEISRPIRAVITKIRKMGIEYGIAVNPETPFRSVPVPPEDIPFLLLMGIHPGKSGQVFLGEPVLQKIREARERYRSSIIEVDGGVNTENIRSIWDAGAHQVCSASCLFSSDDVRSTYRKLVSG